MPSERLKTQYPRFRYKTVQRQVVRLAWEPVHQLAGKAHAHGFRLQTVFHRRKRRIVIAACLPQTVAFAVYADKRDEQYRQTVHADFAPCKLRDMQLRLPRLRSRSIPRSGYGVNHIRRVCGSI